MKKYLYIFKATLIENLQYTLNIILGFLSFFITLYVLINLWQYMYLDTNNIISGYTFNQMIWYVLFTEMMWYGTKNKILTVQISKDIKDGNIAYNINKPYNYAFYIIAKHFGEITIKFLMYLLIGIIVGIAFVGSIENFNFINLPGIIIVTFLSILINSIIRITISMLSFWIEDSEPIHWIYEKAVLILGTIFPIEMFPMWLQPIIRYSPIYVVSYGAAKLVVDFSMNMFINIIISQLIYLAICLAILMIIYNKGVKKLNVNGG